jgi:hypothetical protein
MKKKSMFPLITTFLITLFAVSCGPEAVISLDMVSDPVMTPDEGIYFTAQDVFITSETPGAIFVYTTDGSEPTRANGTVYSTSIPLDTDTDLKVFAYKSGYEDSNVIEKTYSFYDGIVTDPVLSPDGGQYSSNQTVSMNTVTDGATIIFTTDGTEPDDSNGTIYTSPISVTSNTTVKAFAYKADYLDSGTTTENYILKCATPVINVVDQTYTADVTITCATPGVTIRYTTNGSTPSQYSGTQYTGEFTVGKGIMIKAISYKSGWTTSNVASDSAGATRGLSDGGALISQFEVEEF